MNLIEWKNVKVTPYEELYEVSNIGTVRNIKNKRILTGKCKNGYNNVKLSLTRDKVIKENHCAVHRLVAMSFVENDDINTKIFVNHKDGNKLNNKVDNLEWVTSSENTKHAVKTKMLDNTKLKSKPIIVTDINGDEFEYANCAEASKELELPVNTIYSALRRSFHHTTGLSFKYKNAIAKQAFDLSQFTELKENSSYMINRNGDVYSKHQKKLLKHVVSSSGYPRVDIKKVGIKFVHVLVAQTFIPNPENCSDVNHIDHDKLNCNVSNLEWCTRQDNIKKYYLMRKTTINNTPKDSTKVESGSEETSEV